MKRQEQGTLYRLALEHFDSEQGLLDTIKTVKSEAKHQNSGLYMVALDMVERGCFDCSAWTALDTLAVVYGKDFDSSRYLTKGEQLKYRGGEPYIWSIYKHKTALAIEREIKYRQARGWL